MFVEKYAPKYVENVLKLEISLRNLKMSDVYRGRCVQLQLVVFHACHLKIMSLHVLLLPMTARESLQFS